MISTALQVPVKFDDLLWAVGIILMLCGKDKSAVWLGFIFSILGIIF